MRSGPIWCVPVQSGTFRSIPVIIGTGIGPQKLEWATQLQLSMYRFELCQFNNPGSKNNGLFDKILEKSCQKQQPPYLLGPLFTTKGSF